MERMTKGVMIRNVLIILLAAVVFSLLPFDAVSYGAKSLVIIDPAHGGKDKGVGLSRNLYEKDLNLKIAAVVAKILQSEPNIAVLLTRSSDGEISTEDRIRTIRAADARLLVSIHVNAGFGKRATGYEIYFPGFKEVPAEKAGAADIIKDMVGNKFLNESVALAQITMQNLQEVFPRKERGLRSAPLPLLSGLTLPAIIVDIGFATNPEDRDLLVSDKIQERIAMALSKSIREFLRHN